MKTQSLLTKKQVKSLVKYDVVLNSEKFKKVVCNVRYDDSCGNGHNSFGITGDFYYNQREINRNDPSMCGCCHKELAEVFPEISHLIKWHLCSSERFPHYVANTLYHVSDTDHNGLKKGEYSAYILKVVTDAVSNAPIVLYKTDQMYTNKKNNTNLERSNNKQIEKLNEFISSLKVDHEVIKEYSEWSLSKGKEIDIEAARRCAVWPDATLEQLRDRDLLEQRLPNLLNEMRSDLENFGLIW